ncbi:MAG: 1,4-dihydroxy-2-naphthoate polyprenyltransferase [Myxococcales bacterium]|nr:1,4-dihydroxy-2-naphthoate polyprenyltransferase [Myxococcales bacterium]MDH5305594.1 1,4-dihydroxy-2-naphthoate polyprenyltransferase [Myxococcales bacterium]MDH5565240.1 1,4-dihydroxy-2-naphthoate polyprenyltransferase [Myxococcales bacterium]
MATVAPRSLAAPNAWRAWASASRPRTLAVSAAPVLVGTAVAHAHGGARVGPALAACLGAVLIQIGTNLANDFFDAEKGADGEDRIGPPRAVQMGWLTPAQVRRGAALVFAAAGLVGLYLIAVAGWPIALLGTLSIAAGIAYTGGPWPLAYHGLGDVAVFVFFGVAAVCGTCYVQLLTLPADALAASLSIGALATAVLVVNNLRDIDTDQRAGKRTLAVRIGRRGTRVEFGALLVLAYAVPVGLWLGAQVSAWILLPLATLPRAVRLLRVVWRRVDGPALNDALADTARLGLVFALLFALGWIGGAA